jgi:hypothetical protein
MRSAPACDALRDMCTTSSVVRGMRAVLGHWAGDSLPLPQAKSPLTVAWGVILFGPEPYCQGSGSLALRVGVGRRNGQLHRWVRTPHRKIRARFHGYKHTSLISLLGKSSRVRLSLAQKTIFVTVVVTL